MILSGHYLFWPDSALLTERRYKAISHVPVIFHPEWRYHLEASRYLRERSKPTKEDVEAKIFRTRREPTRQSLKSYAERLVNFLDWCLVRGRKEEGETPFWEEVDYEGVARYGKEMEAGTFSAKGKLKTSTIELRKDTACEFLEWAAARGLRGPIDVPKRPSRYYRESAFSTHTIVGETETRTDKKRPSKEGLRIPTDQEVARWLRSLRIKFGPTKYLMASLILQTGIRIQELASWRIDTLSADKTKWHITHISAQFVSVELKYGTKGPKSDGPDGVIGPIRNISLPIELAERLWQYQEYERPRLVRLYVKSAATKEEQARRRVSPPKQLFLSDYLGVPVTASRLREAWKGAHPLPFPEWHPHHGRDYWSCKTLMLGLEREMKQASIQANSGVVSNWIQGNAETIIQTQIQPQLGHLDSKTTKQYIKWVEGAFDLTILHDAYARRIGDVCGECEQET